MVAAWGGLLGSGLTEWEDSEDSDWASDSDMSLSSSLSGDWPQVEVDVEESANSSTDDMVRGEWAEYSRNA